MFICIHGSGVLSSNNLHVVLDYPYENALCLFLTKHLNPDFYTRVKNAKHPYYDFLLSRIPKGALETALDLAVIFDQIHVHPIDLPIYQNQDVVQPSSYRNQTARDIFDGSQKTDLADQKYQSLISHFRTRHRQIVAQRVNWHLLDSHFYDAPIFTSPKLRELYNYKFSRACLPSDTEAESYLKAFNAIESILGVSFRIEDLDQLIAIRNDKDIGRFRRKLHEFSSALRQDPTRIEDLRTEIKTAINKLREIESFNRATKIISCVSLPISIAALCFGQVPPAIAIAKLSPSIASASLNVWNKLRKRKYSWVLFVTKLR